MKMLYILITAGMFVFICISLLYATNPTFHEAMQVINPFNQEEVIRQAGEPFGAVQILNKTGWEVISATGEEGQLTFWKSGTDKKVELGWIPPDNSCTGWVDKFLYDETNTKILDNKNKDIKLKCESSKCDGQNCYHISLTDAQAVNINDYVKLGENSIVTEYQETNIINYDFGTGETNITLYKLGQSQNDVFVFWDSNKYKFGANDTSLGENETAQYTYVIESTDTIRLISLEPKFSNYIDGDYEEYDFSDICSESYSNCEWDYSPYRVEINFTSDSNIDPAIDRRLKPTEEMYTGNNQIEEYTSDSKKICNDGVCTMQLYGGQKYAKKDNGKWDLKENVENWKQTPGLKKESYIEKDSNFNMDVVGFNETSITIGLSVDNSLTGQDIPLRLWKRYKPVKNEDTNYKSYSNKYIEENVTFELLESIEEINGTNETIYYSSTEERTFDFDDFSFIEFGFNSTTVVLNLTSGGVLEDTYIRSGSALSNYGGDSEMLALKAASYEDNMLIKFDISSLPNSIKILNSNLSILLDYTALDGDYEGYNISVNHLYNSWDWEETEPTWNTKPTEGTDYNITFTDTILFDGLSDEDVYYSWDITNIIQEQVGEDNVSFYMISHDYFGSPSSADVLNFEPKESVVRGEYINIEYQFGAFDYYDYYKNITIDEINVDSDLTDFPILVKFEADADINSHALSSGNDIRFTDANRNEIPYEREFFNGTDGIFWVKVPTVSSSSNTTIQMWYGNKTADAGLDGEDAVNVWDSNYGGVWHLKESSGTVYDSTSNNNDLTAGGTPTYSQTGKIGSGIHYGSGDAHSIASPTNLKPSTTVTVEAWVSRAGTGSGQYQQFVGFTTTGYEFDLYQSNPRWEHWVNDGDWGTPAEKTGITYPGTSTWEHLVGTYDSSTDELKIKQNNNAGTSGVQTQNIVYSGSFLIGTPDSAYIDGVVDEVRVSRIVRSDAWLKFGYNNMNSANNELTFGAENDTAGAADTSFTITFPANTDMALFNGSAAEESDFQPQNQSSTVALLIITNTGDTTLNISLYINGSLPAGFYLKADTDNDVAGALEITSSSKEISSGLAASGEEEIWLWGNYSYQTPQTVNSQLNVSVAEHT